MQRWQRAINLVGQSTLADPWRWHVLDSAQLLAHLPPGAASLVDLGSGAGFPGLVLAVLGARGVVLVESDRRKAQFLREVARSTGTAVVVEAARIEDLPRRIAITRGHHRHHSQGEAHIAPYVPRGATGPTVPDRVATRVIG